jgi:phospholipid transport system transporter-binding protein
VNRGEDGSLQVEGPITFANVEAVLSEGLRSFDAAQVRVDLGGVTEVDSAALSLLLEWVRQAASKGQRVVFVNLPPNLTSLARLYGITELIPTAG